MTEHAPQATGPRPVQNQTRRDAVVNELRRAILSGELEPGQRLREVQISQQLGVSRPTLREAIYQLTHEGLLEQQPYRGVVVTELGEKFISDVAEVRVVLEQLAARDLANDPDGSRKEKLRRSWAEYQAAHASQDPERLHQAHVNLHKCIWTASGNSMLERMWPTVEAQINIAITMDESARSDPDRALHVHERVIEAILAGDPATIDAEVERHTKSSADELLVLLAERKESISTSDA